jgi:predicted aldo/keto reductase-like oxidoreductase
MFAERTVDVVLCGPANTAQLDENLQALSRGPLSAEEMQFMRSVDDALHRGRHVPGAPA